MAIREMRRMLGDTGARVPSRYTARLSESSTRRDVANRRTTALPQYNPKKMNLPQRMDYVGAISWLRDVNECVGEPIIFALDEALMCQGNFAGRSDEFLLWAYGSDRLSRFNGIVILGNQVNPCDVVERNGLKFTDFNRTIADALANESILDMQGITEAVSKYYYSNGESFEGISVPPEYQERFECLAHAAIEYYDEETGNP